MSEEEKVRYDLGSSIDTFEVDNVRVIIECKVRPGRVSEAIKTFASTIDALLVVMKTQKPHGKEKFPAACPYSGLSTDSQVLCSAETGPLFHASFHCLRLWPIIRGASGSR